MSKKHEPTGAEWKSRENKDGFREWTLVKLAGRTLPTEARPVVFRVRNTQACGHDPKGEWMVTIDGEMIAQWEARLPSVLIRCEEWAAENEAKFWRREARRLAK